MKKALFVWGGWDGHEPKQTAELFASIMQSEGFEVEVSDTLDSFADTEKMMALSLVVPVWTMGQLTGEQSKGLMSAVRSGVGFAGWHGGAGDAFRGETEYLFMVGGQWVWHPGGVTHFQVDIIDHQDPITAGLADFKMASEPYYMHVDPSNHVLATMTFSGADAPWIEGCVMPVAWKRVYGEGRVFYSSLGHYIGDFDVAECREMQKRGMLWAAR